MQKMYVYECESFLELAGANQLAKIAMQDTGRLSTGEEDDQQNAAHRRPDRAAAAAPLANSPVFPADCSAVSLHVI